MSIENEIAELNTSIRLLIAKIGEQINAIGAPRPGIVGASEAVMTGSVPLANAAVSVSAAKPAAKKATETPPPPAAPKSSDSGSTQPPAGATGSLDYEKDVKPLALKAIALGQKDAAKKQAYTDLLAKIGAPSAKAMSAEHYPAFVAGLKEIVS